MMELATVWRFAKGGAVLLLALLIYLKGSADKDAQWEARYSRDIANRALAVQGAEAQARQVEQGWAAAMDAAASALIQENLHVASQRDRLLADARAGRLRVPSACTATDLPEAAPGTAGTDAAAGGGLPRPAGGEAAFVEFLIGEAARADNIAAQLRGLQEADRALRR